MAKFTKFDLSDSKDARFGLDACRFIRCQRHEDIPQLNTTEGTEAECGGCIAEEVWILDRRVLPDILDGFAGYLIDHARLGQRLHEAYQKLNLQDPGSGDDLRKRQLADEMRRIAAETEQEELRKMPLVGGVN